MQDFLDPENQGQADDVPPDPAVTPEEGQATFDPASQMVNFAGREMTVEQVIASAHESEKAMRLSQESDAQSRKQLDELAWAPDFMKEVQERPGLYDHIESFYKDNDARVPESIDPNAHVVKDLNTKVESLRIDNELLELKAEGMPVTPERKQATVEYMLRSGVKDTRAAFWGLYGPELVKQGKVETAQKTAESLTKNRQKYQATPTGSAGGGKPDVASMSQTEWDAAVTSAIDAALGSEE